MVVVGVVAPPLMCIVFVVTDDLVRMKWKWLTEYSCVHVKNEMVLETRKQGWAGGG